MATVKQGFDGRVENIVGADLRLIYGLGVPALIAIGFIIGLAVIGESWLLVGVMTVVVGLTLVVVAGIAHVLSESDHQDIDDKGAVLR